MNPSTATPTEANSAIPAGSFLLPYIGRGLEALWLLAAFLVPLIFVGQDYAISEAKIAYVEVPKVALLRTIAGLIAVLWSLEWAISSKAFQGSLPSISFLSMAEKLQPSKGILALNNWLKVHPTRWLLLAATLFFGSTLLSTVLSGSFTNSMWGEIPGQDGYSAYTVASYGILFGVIATHLKKRAQLSRLLGAIVLMGILVGIYGCLQHYHHDFFGITEGTGGGAARVTIFMGNAIFAAAVLAMTVPLTLVAAAINFHDETWGNFRPLVKLGQLGRDFIFTSLWASILSVQLLGLMFTFSRGSWGGAVLALVVFLILVVLSLGFRILLRTGLVLGLAAILSVAFLQWQGSVSVITASGSFGPLLALLGLAGTVSVLFIIKRFGTAVVLIATVGAITTIVIASVIAPIALSGRGDTGPTSTSPISGLSAEQVTGRITSIKTDVLGGFSGGRSTHWKVSWELIKNRPWFEFDDLGLSWIRPLIGYGPDLFRYTYLLESPPELTDAGLRPLQPDHAHNFFIHQTVEQGAIGGLASLSLFASVFGVVGHLLIFRRKTGNPVYRLLVIGLMALVLGRFLEMMVGVARISDLTVLWVILGLFVASAGFIDEKQEEPNAATNQDLRRLGRRERREVARVSASWSFSTGLIFRLAIVAWLVGSIGVVTWQKSINSVRASIAEGQAFEYFNNGDLENAVKKLDKAIKLAPGVPHYYNNRAQVFLSYQLNPEAFIEPGCSQQTEMAYLSCLGVEILESNLESVRQQPFHYRSQLAAGNSAFNLGLIEFTMEFYGHAAEMVPNSYNIRNDFAESLIDNSLFDEALLELDSSLAISGDLHFARSVRALYLKGRALNGLGRFDDAINTLKHGLSVNNVSEYSVASLALLREIYTEQGVLLDTDYFNAAINKHPQDAVSLYFRGLANFNQGNTELAIRDIEKSYDLGLTMVEVVVNRAYVSLKIGPNPKASLDLAAAVHDFPQNPLFNAYYGEIQRSNANYSLAFTHLDIANILDPDLGLAYLARSKIYMALGSASSAKDALDSSPGLNLLTAPDYVDRGEIYAFLGEYNLAFLDLDEAIRINPNQAAYYNARAKAYANFHDLQYALADFATAIRIDPTNGQYFINRGVVYDILGETASALADFEIARSLGTIDIPVFDERNPSYFAVHTSSTSTRLADKLILKLKFENQALRDITSHSKTLPTSPNYPTSLQFLSQAHLELEMWTAATDDMSKLIQISPSTAEAYRTRGDAYFALNRHEEANNDYFRAVGLGEANPYTVNTLNLVAMGKGYAEIGEYDLARDNFDAAISLDPNSSDAYASRGYLSVQTGNYSLAFPDINRAIEISRFNHDAFLKRANAYIGFGQTSLAAEDLAQAIELAPLNTNYLYALGLLRYTLSELGAAIENFSEAIELKEGFAYVDPRHVKPFLARGRAYLETGKPQQALDDANSSIQLLTDNFAKGWDSLRPQITVLLVDARDLRGDASAKLSTD